jgi:hypothetical protein
MPLRKEDFEEALVEFKKLRNFRHRNVVEAIAYCKEPAMFGMTSVRRCLSLFIVDGLFVFSHGIHGRRHIERLAARWQ